MNIIKQLSNWDNLRENEKLVISKLEILNLGNSQLTNLPEGLGQLKNLTHLQLSNNQLKKLSETIGQLKNLIELYLWDNQLNNLPEEIGNLTQLKELHLWNNKLIILPETIGNLTELERLDLENNQLNKLPEMIGQLTGLEYLNLKKNKLKIIPETIGQLTKLTYLDLTNNNLTILPETIGQLKILTTLKLSWNKLTILPESISELIDTEIYAQGNQFIQLGDYLLVNPTTILSPENLHYKVKPVNEALNQNNINAYLDACIDKNWTLKPETSALAYKLITGQNIKIEPSTNILEIEYYQEINKAYKETRNEQLKKLLLTTNKELLETKGIINPEIDTIIPTGNYRIIL